MPAPATPRQDVPPAGFSATIRTTFWMSGALCCFIAMALAGREATKSVATIEIMIACAFIATAAVLAILAIKGEGFGVLKTSRILTHLGRNAFQFGGQMGWFYALTLLPLAQVFAYEFTDPLAVDDFKDFCVAHKATLVHFEQQGGAYRFLLRRDA